MTASAAITFLVAKLFLRFWGAVWLAFATALTGWITFIAMLFVQAPFYPGTLTGNQPTTYLGTAAVLGLLVAIAAGWIAVRVSQRR
ncbi:hypothetical protein [Brevundimonas sp.]|uniref:hypothetical protein n=1 Tax=Brevundimonas sp. TaxID=1871086 RepID=UPI002FC7B942